ncbi:hypothetical protein [Capnocytophaga sp.]|uniref:hypothetical protein n=1 Tax=Capnocytophaga sp. TaxID=44737 RepID=UPI0026DDCA33|nr:hypothetical protein [Capnocytophaga sp.]MDO5106073.1 hypothetical protein [Capnocytophaga sp.]
MCYVLTLSTDLPEDLAKFDTETLFFEKIDPKNGENRRKILKYPHQYEIATMAKNNCSCHLRIFEQDLALEVGFCPLQDWLEEEEDDDTLRTREFFGIVKQILAKGYHIDSYVSWNGDESAVNQQLIVKTNDISEAHFALFSDFYFEYE